MKQYSSIEELTLTLALYPTQKEYILEEAGKKFKLDGKDAWFVVAEDGNCGLFNSDCELDKLSKIESINIDMIINGIKKINIPESVKKIEAYAFTNQSLLTDVVMPDGIEDINDGTFNRCTSLININIPQSVCNIKYAAFNECRSLTSIDIPESVKQIGSFAFSNCTSLMKVIVYGNLAYAGGYVFKDCDSLKEIIFKEKTFGEVIEMSNYPWGIENESIIKCKS